MYNSRSVYDLAVVLVDQVLLGPGGGYRHPRVSVGLGTRSPDPSWVGLAMTWQDVQRASSRAPTWESGYTISITFHSSAYV